MSMSMGTGGAGAPGERPEGLRWGAPSAEAGAPAGAGGEASKTSRSATFVHKNVSYTVTVDYDRNAIMDKYRIDDHGRVDAMIEEIFADVSLNHLSALAGYTVNTSLDDVSNAEYQPLSGGDFMPISELRVGNPVLFKTIQQVVGVFAKFKSGMDHEKEEEVEGERERGKKRVGGEGDWEPDLKFEVVREEEKKEEKVELGREERKEEKVEVKMVGEVVEEAKVGLGGEEKKARKVELKREPAVEEAKIELKRELAVEEAKVELGGGEKKEAKREVAPELRAELPEPAKAEVLPEPAVEEKEEVKKKPSGFTFGFERVEEDEKT